MRRTTQLLQRWVAVAATPEPATIGGGDDGAPSPGKTLQAQGTANAATSSLRKDSASWVYKHWVAGEGEGNKQKWSCLYCKNAQYRHNVTRMRNHLITCSLTPPDVQQQAAQRCTIIAERKDSRTKDKKSKGDINNKNDGETSNGNKRKLDEEAQNIVLGKKQAMDGDITHQLDVLFCKAYSSLKWNPDCLKDRKLQKFLHTLNPQYKLPCENTLRSMQIQLRLTNETFEDHNNNAGNANTNAAANANSAAANAAEEESLKAMHGGELKE